MTSPRALASRSAPTLGASHWTGRTSRPENTLMGGNTLPRKPNYRFERLERERAKAARKTARLKEKADRRNASATERDPADDEKNVETTPGVLTDINQS